MSHLGEGPGQGNGQGTGPRGQGGGTPEEGPISPPATEDTLLPGRLSSTTIVGKQWVRGLPMEGQAQAEVAEARTLAAAAAEGALRHQRLPTAYRDLVRRYFDSLTEPPPAKDR